MEPTKKNKIIIAEEEPQTAQQLKNILEKLGHEVRAVVRTGEDALTEADRHHPDLAVLGVVLDGGLDGFETAEALSQTPVVLATAAIDDYLLGRARSIHHYGYLVKPYHERDVQARLETAFQAVRTERQLRRTEEHLAQSRDLHRSLFTAMNEGVCLHEILYGPDGQAVDYVILDVNPAYEIITGLKRDQVVGGRASEIYGTGSAPYLKEYAQAVADGRPFSFELWWPPMKKCLNVSVFVQPHGRFGTVFKDITDRKTAEEELRATRARLEATLNALPDLMFEVDPDGRIEGYRSNRPELLNAGPELFLGRTLSEALPPGPAAAVKASLDQADAMGSHRGTIYSLEMNGMERWYELSVARRGDQMDPSRRFVALARDVTERVGADRRVLTAIKEKDRLLQELHHRVKNNMQVIISLLSLKARKSRSTLVKEAIQESQNRIYAMALVHESLHGAGQPIGLGVQVYVQRLAQYLINLYQGPETGIQLTIEVPGNFELGVDQAIPCGLILNELLTNALKYAFVGRDRGEIRLGARVDEDGRARIWVHDDGVGLPEGLDWLKTDTLGLSLVRNLAISQLKGEFRREPSPGTHFTLVF